MSPPPDAFSLDQRRLVVTGASSGIGQAIAVAMGKAGCSHIVLQYRQNRQGIEQTLERLANTGCSATAIAAEFGDDRSRRLFVEEAFETLGQVDAWIQSAGADVLTGEAAEWTFQEKLRRLIEVDLVGSIEIGRQVGDILSGQSESRPDDAAPSMVFIGWDQAAEGMEGDAGQMFGPIKAGVDAFSKSLAQDLSPHVRVNTLAPGWIRTAWGGQTSPYWDSRARAQALMNRWGTPDDIAAAAVFLASPGASFITGQTLVVNGGWNRRYEDHT